jgi:hypothetical protein
MALNESDPDETSNPQVVPSPQKQQFVGFMEKYDSKDLGKNYRYNTNILKMVEEMDKEGKNLCIFLEEDFELGGDISPDNHKLVGLHHLHCSPDKDLVGFRGYDFSSPVVLPPSSLIGSQT